MRLLTMCSTRIGMNAWTGASENRWGRLVAPPSDVGRTFTVAAPLAARQVPGYLGYGSGSAVLGLVIRPEGADGVL